MMRIRVNTLIMLTFFIQTKANNTVFFVKKSYCNIFKMKLIYFCQIKNLQQIQ